VYRARDPRLARDVALKIVPEPLCASPERLERIDREARALAAISHPSIAAIYDIAEHDGTRALVLELVEGDTLAERLRGGPLSLDETVRIARALAEALDAAHERGLVHRDVKPANVKITPAGDVKVLDFGLARMLQPHDASETATMTATAQGAIVGTPAYMSPEQARGLPADKRADVWAFGCVLYEMLGGRAPFHGDTWSDSIARTLTMEPDWSALPAGTPPPVVHLIGRCLQKDPAQRLRGLGGIELALETFGPAPPAARRTSRWPWVALAALVLATGAWALWRDRPSAATADAGTVRFEVPPSIRMAESGAFALSPDGRRLAFIGTGADGRFQIWERSLDSLEPRPVNGTEDEVAGNTTLFWSPDSRHIGFYSAGAVKRIQREGGVAQVVCRLSGVAVGGTWNRRGDIVVGNVSAGLMRCPEEGGEPTQLTGGTPTDGTSPAPVHMMPVFLPDGRHVLYLRVSRTDASGNGLYLADLNRPPEDQRGERLIETGYGARYARDAGGFGHILFVRNRGVWAVGFDEQRLTTRGEPELVVPSVGTFRDGAFFDTNGPTVVYRVAADDFQLAWRDRKGRHLGAVGEPGRLGGVALAPDGSRAAVVREGRSDRSDQDFWIVDLRRDVTTRLTSDSFPKSIPAWSPGGDELFFVAGLDSADVRARPLDGGRERTMLRGADLEGLSVNPLLTTISAGGDRRRLVFNVDTRGPTRSDIWVLALDSPGAALPLVEQEFDQVQPAVSPDNRWLAYASNESGRFEIVVRALSADASTGRPAVGSAVPVSRNGGRSPRWRADGRELFFQSPDDGIMAAPVSPASIAEPTRLFTAAGARPEWGVAPDGQRFLLTLPAVDREVPFTVVLNWIPRDR
jgi:Tol biopolymer transport system component